MALLTGLTPLLVAQTLKKTEKIEADQVPVAIRSAFVDDFGTMPDGYWIASFEVEK